MAYTITIDERFAGGTSSFSVGVYDAPGEISTNMPYKITPNSSAFGFAGIPITTHNELNPDIDIYQLGTLNPGVYQVNVGKFNWDSNFPSGATPLFSILDASGNEIGDDAPDTTINFGLGSYSFDTQTVTVPLSTNTSCNQ